VVAETGAWPAEVPFSYQSNWLAPPGMTTRAGTQLYLTETRVYDPEDVRFLQRDLRKVPRKNQYVYARGNPVNRVDPAGPARSATELHGPHLNLWPRRAMLHSKKGPRVGLRPEGNPR
jgi:RHS repeat-associated protein